MQRFSIREDAITSWHITNGQVRGIDVTGMAFLGVAKIPGNVFAGNWKLVVYMDDWATQEQRDALIWSRTAARMVSPPVWSTASSPRSPAPPGTSPKLQAAA